MVGHTIQADVLRIKSAGWNSLRHFGSLGAHQGASLVGAVRVIDLLLIHANTEMRRGVESWDGEQNKASGTCGPISMCGSKQDISFRTIHDKNEQGCKECQVKTKRVEYEPRVVEQAR